MKKLVEFGFGIQEIGASRWRVLRMSENKRNENEREVCQEVLQRFRM